MNQPGWQWRRLLVHRLDKAIRGAVELALWANLQLRAEPTNSAPRPAQASAFTVPQLAFAQQQLNRLAGQKAVLVKQQESITAAATLAEQRHELNRKAGKINGAAAKQYDLECRDRSRQYAALGQKIAALDLQELDVRQRYKLPLPATVTTGTKPKKHP